jgi:2-alkyl-3-oxoalkanoate reductase
MSTRVALVTGGGGFLGKALCRALRDRGYTVKSFSRGRYQELEDMGVENIQGDLGDKAEVSLAVRGCDVVFHVAAKPGIWGTFASYHSANVTGTKNIVDACAEHAVPHLVYTSSPSVTFSGRDQEGSTEAEPYAKTFLAHYPRTKAEAEPLVLNAHTLQLKTISLRPHLIWGPGDNHLVPRVLSLGAKNRIRFVGQQEKLIDTVYIDNAVEAHLLAYDRLCSNPETVGGKCYFITNQEPWTHEAVINGFLRAGRMPAVSRRIPAFVAYAVGALLEGVYHLLGRENEPPMTRFVARQLATAHWFDPRAAREELGYIPKISMAEGLRRLETHLHQHTENLKT